MTQKCENQRCGQVDDGMRPIKVYDRKLTAECGKDSKVISVKLCDLCYFDMIISAGAYLPHHKAKALLPVSKVEGSK